MQFVTLGQGGVKGQERNGDGVGASATTGVVLVLSTGGNGLEMVSIYVNHVATTPSQVAVYIRNQSPDTPRLGLALISCHWWGLNLPRFREARCDDRGRTPPPENLRDQVWSGGTFQVRRGYISRASIKHSRTALLVSSADKKQGNMLKYRTITC